MGELFLVELLRGSHFSFRFDTRPHCGKPDLVGVLDIASVVAPLVLVEIASSMIYRNEQGRFVFVKRIALNIVPYLFDPLIYLVGRVEIVFIPPAVRPFIGFAVGDVQYFWFLVCK